MRALIPIVGSNEQQLEHIITHQLFGKTKTSWWATDSSASAAHRWLLLSHIVKYALPTRTMFNILQQIIKVIFKHFSNNKSDEMPMKSFDEVTDDIQMRVCRFETHLEMLVFFFQGKSIEISLSFITLYSRSTAWKFFAND